VFRGFFCGDRRPPRRTCGGSLWERGKRPSAGPALSDPPRVDTKRRGSADRAPRRLPAARPAITRRRELWSKNACQASATGDHGPPQWSASEWGCAVRFVGSKIRHARDSEVRVLRLVVRLLPDLFPTGQRPATIAARSPSGTTSSPPILARPAPPRPRKTLPAPPSSTPITKTPPQGHVLPLPRPRHHPRRRINKQIVGRIRQASRYCPAGAVPVAQRLLLCQAERQSCDSSGPLSLSSSLHGGGRGFRGGPSSG